MSSTQDKIDSAIARVVRSDEFSEDTLTAMAVRCESQGHEYEGCVSALFHFYNRCRWCGRIPDVEISS